MSGTLATILLIIACILIVLGVLVFLNNRRNTGAAAQAYKPTALNRTPEEELSALGILEIKPRAVGARDETEDAGDVEIIDVESEELEEADVVVDEALADEAEEAVEEDPEEVIDTDLEPVSDETEVADQDVTATAGNRKSGVSRREALFRMLNAVQASVDGYTACLIKRENDGRCSVEAIVSQNPQALGSKSLQLDHLLDDQAPAGTAVVVKDLDPNKAAMEELGYYATPVSIRQVAIAPIKAPGDEASYYLLVDALGWQDLDDPWQRLMIGQFANLLGTFMSTPVLEGDSGEFIKPRVRPRREIIAEEIDRARTKKHPLALALIYLNRAEQVADEGGKAISDAERAMATRLELSVNGGRLERFGELTYGIFQDEGVSEVEAWALQLQEELVRESDHFEGGVSIGIALLQDRHKDADEFRADATEALREAFETGATTIIE
ncbi:MAG: GGDEF domain-containing protein [Bacteroidota bacterium]